MSRYQVFTAAWLLAVAGVPWLLRWALGRAAATWVVIPGVAMHIVIGLIFLFVTGPRIEALGPAPMVRSLGALMLVSAALLTWSLTRGQR